MNTIVILSIVPLAAFFLIVIMSLLRMLVEFIRERDLFGACFDGLALVVVCCAVVFCFISIRPCTKQIVCTDYQVEERVDSFGNTTFVITYER